MANLTFSELKSWIQVKLGGETVCSDLKPGAIEAAINDAFEWWAAYKGFYREDTISIVADQVSYDLSLHDPEVLDVVKMYFSWNHRMDLSSSWAGFLDLSGVPYGQYPFAESATGIYGSLVQNMQIYDTASRVVSMDNDFIFNQETKELLVSPVPSDSGTAVYLYSTPFKDDYLKYIPPRDMMLIRRRTLAEAKETLGYIRGKYGSMPAAQGSVTLDGDALRSEAINEKDKLDKEILDLCSVVLPLVG
jgi:hypothetical protein